jgi:predicted nucleotidyltransferase
MAIGVMQLSREQIIRRVRAGVMAVRDDVMAIVIFGSFARSKSFRDIDVLVVVRGAPSSRLLPCPWT